MPMTFVTEGNGRQNIIQIKGNDEGRAPEVAISRRNLFRLPMLSNWKSLPYGRRS